MRLTALYADENGEIYDAPGYQPLGRSGVAISPLTELDYIPLPAGAEIMYLPGRQALALQNGRETQIPDGGRAVAAVLPAGYTRTHLPAFSKQDGAPVLPLYGYAAVAARGEELVVAAVRSDQPARWNPEIFNTPDLRQKVVRVKKQLRGNRIVEQLARCALEWHCCTAQNLFYARWEAGVPVSPVCNAKCFGCISLQPAECCPAPQSRIQFRPTEEEVAELGIYHLAGAPEGMISFGQGCEGEPSLAAEVIVGGIRRIRDQVVQGLININTNAGYDAGIRRIVDAGLDAMRVSMISARPDTYQAYYQPEYTLDNVRESIRYAKEQGVYVSLNMLTYPGLNDREEELAAWEEWIGALGIDMVQLRNLNVDPDELQAILPPAQGQAVGIRAFIERLQQKFPRLVIGSYSRCDLPRRTDR